jgi:hypothetical protein
MIYNTETPRTDHAYFAAHGGAIRDAAGGVIDGVTHEEDLISRLLDLSREMERELAEQKRRIAAVLDLIDGREDVEDKPDCGDEQIVRPNLEMRIGMALRGEDRP